MPIISYAKAFKRVNDAYAIRLNGDCDEILYPGCDSSDKSITLVSPLSGITQTITSVENTEGVVVVNCGTELRFKCGSEWIDIMPLHPRKIR